MKNLMLRWTSSLLIAASLVLAGCPGTSGEGEGESNTAEGEGDTSEGEGDTAEGEGDTGVEGEAFIEATNAIDRLLDVLQGYSERCQGGLTRIVDGDQAATDSAAAFILQARPPWPAGTAPDFAAIEACGALIASDTTCTLNGQNNACSRLFTADRPDGESCGDSLQCEGQACAFDMPGDCGVCATAVPSCQEDAACAEGEYCDFRTLTCVPPGPLGSECGSDSGCLGDNVCSFGADRRSCIQPVPDGGACAAGPCRKESECDGVLCRPLPDEGEPCFGECSSTDLTCIMGTCGVLVTGNSLGAPCTAADPTTCDVYRSGLICGADSMCTPVDVAEPGESCDQFQTYCRGSVVAGTSVCLNQVCVAAVALGGACVNTQVAEGPPCVPGARCDDGLCVPRSAIGQPCAEDVCVPGSICSNGICAIIRGLNEPCRDGICGNGQCLDGICMFIPDEEFCPVGA
jgi:Dickkopf N-terminal cysteine-rich region